MCGIAGAVSVRPLELEPARLEEMAAVIRYRGPDHAGFHRDAHAALASVRLAIIDTAGGNQPISNEDGSLHIVYNGECYNFQELRPGLEQRGHVFRTRCDTEVVLHLYEELGPECLAQMNGQFALAIWDSRKRELFLARDRLGVRPLFYAERDGTLVFGSEAKALFASGLVPAEPDLRALDAITSFACVVAPNTPFRGVKALPPGMWLRWRGGRSELARYWEIPFPEAGQEDRLDERRAAARLFEELARAVRLRMISDVPLGAYLSGGLDSSCVVHLMAALHDGPLTTFSITFREREYDESRYIRLMMGAVRTDNDLLACSQAEIARAFPRLIWHAETPMISTESVPLMLLSGLARRKVKVVLTGEGSDELFGGYSYDRFEKFRSSLSRLPWRVFAPFVRTFFRRRTGPYYRCFFPTRERLEEAVRLFGVYPARSMEHAFFELVRRMTYTDEMLSRASSYDQAENLPLDREWLRRLHPFNASLYLSHRLFLAGHLLAAHGDRASMANSVEGRYPFLDHNVVELCARMPPELKMKGFREKHILRVAFAGRLPPEIASRRKQPFLAPFGVPFLGPEAPPEVAELLSESSIRRKGYFDWPRFRSIVERLEELGPLDSRGGERQALRLSREAIERVLLGMAVTFVLSVQVWDEVFFRGASWPRSMPSVASEQAAEPAGAAR